MIPRKNKVVILWNHSVPELEKLNIGVHPRKDPFGRIEIGRDEEWRR